MGPMKPAVSLEVTLTICQDILDKASPSHKEMALFLSLISSSKREDQLEVSTTFSKVKEHFTSFINSFSELTFQEGFGFDPFTMKDILLFLLDPSQFNLSLKKEAGCGLLYGHDHVKLRQTFINLLPHEIRFHCLMKKFSYCRLSSKLSAFLKPVSTLPEILDILDIGAGHSVYLVTASVGEAFPRQVVVKQEALPNQSLFCKLLDSLSWPSYESEHFEEQDWQWEISEYLGNLSLQEMLKEVSVENRDSLEMQLAQHAALGDILGRGDRHFENYMVSTWGIVPIDISFLFWEGNEAWSERYIAGGIYELSILEPYSIEELPKKMKRFFSFYEDTVYFLKKEKPNLENQISTFFSSQNMDVADKLAFVQNRLARIEGYVCEQKKSYISSFFEMKKRLVYKEIVSQLYEANPACLDETPWLKMYYLSDKDRPSCFFLLEEKQYLLHDIERLAALHLEIQPGYFSSQWTRIEKEKNKVLSELCSVP